MSTTQVVFVSVAVVLIAFFSGVVDSQLTFSPDWGKRSSAGGGSVTTAGAFFETERSRSCKPSNDMLLEIFRFVQAEAQLFLDCKHRE